MTPMQQWLRTLGILAVCTCACFALWRASRALDVAHMALWNIAAAAYDAKPTLDRANATLDAISGPRGTLHEVNKAIVKIGDMAVTSQKQVAQSSELVDAAAGAITSATRDVHTMAAAGTEALSEGKRTMQAAQPLLASLTRTADASTLTVQHFDALVTSKDLADALTNVQYTTQNVAGVTLDLRKVSDKAAADYLSPKPWYRKVGRFAGDAFDYGALFARHVP